MTNFNLYRDFYYVVKHKNLTKASEVLYISQPAVSSSIKELEGQVGKTLLPIHHRYNSEYPHHGPKLFLPQTADPYPQKKGPVAADKNR